MKLLLFVLVVLLGWMGYRHFSGGEEASTPAPLTEAPVQTAEAQVPAPSFQCDGRQHCSQMTSRAEAEFFVRNCPDTKMDGDHDGEPCENDSRF